jgi:nickel/cobalt transporter (NicO) family protein
MAASRTAQPCGLTGLLWFAFDSGGADCCARCFRMPGTTTTLTTIAALGFPIAFLHAAIPTHWLPFVLVGRARRWSRAKTVAVTVAAGLGHVALTSLLGLAIAWFGFKLNEQIGGVFPWVAGAVLAGLGLFYWWRQWRGVGICHHHPPGSSHHPDAHCGEAEDQTHWEDELSDSPLVSSKVGDTAAVGGLFVMLTISPCEAFLPVYLSGVQFGWRGFVVLSVILAVAALAGMTLFTWLALYGFDRIRIQRFERHEAGLLGAIFLLLAVVVVLLER